MDDVYSMGKIECSPCSIQKPTKMKAQKDIIEQETITYERSYKDAPGERVSLDEVKRKRKRAHGSGCFLCGRAGFSGDESTAVGRMYKLFRTEYAKHDSDELFSNLETFYREEIYNLYIEQGLSAPLLNKEQLKIHFLHHTLEPTTFLSEEIRSLRDVAEVIKKNLFERDVQGNLDVQQKKLKDLMAVQTQILMLYNQSVSRMNFFESTTSVVAPRNKKKA